MALRAQHIIDTGQVEQPEQDLIRAYTQARQLAGPFEERLRLAKWPGGVQAQARPNKVKSLERLVEKYLYARTALVVPVDILGAKVVVDSLWGMYDVAAYVQRVFPVVAYRDRVVRPQSSGYRDLQFVLDVNGHYTELKVMHAMIDELDGFEHRLYEIRRGLQAKESEQQANMVIETEEVDLNLEDADFGDPVLTPIEQLVLDTLDATSADLFNQAWKMILAAEALQRQEGGSP